MFLFSLVLSSLGVCLRAIWRAWALPRSHRRWVRCEQRARPACCHVFLLMKLFCVAVVLQGSQEEQQLPGRMRAGGAGRGRLALGPIACSPVAMRQLGDLGLSAGTACSLEASGHLLAIKGAWEAVTVFCCVLLLWFPWVDPVLQPGAHWAAPADITPTSPLHAVPEAQQLPPALGRL